MAGVDEVGRGPLAGPVTAAAVVLPPHLNPEENWLAAIDDSKRLSPSRREQAAALIRTKALAYSVQHVSPEEIDCIGIGRAVLKAMFAAVSDLVPAPNAVLFDWVPLKHYVLPYRTIAKGDAKSLSIGAASILAKVARDEIMTLADKQYPGYGFARHKGYATAQHLGCLAKIGPCPIHRRSFSPLRQARLLPDAT